VEPVAPPVIVGTQIRAPKLALLPTVLSPRRELLLSALLHTSILAIVVNLPILFPAWTVMAIDSRDADLRREADFKPLFLPVLPPNPDSSPNPGVRPKSADVAHRSVVTLPTASGQIAGVLFFAGTSALVFDRTRTSLLRAMKILEG